MEKLTSSICIEMDTLLEAYLDDDLGEFEVARLHRHLDDCPRCRLELAWARQIRQGLRELPQLACPESVMESVRALSTTVATEGAAPPQPEILDSEPVSSSAAPPHPRRRAFSGWRAVLIAASLSAVLLTGWLLRPLVEDPVSPPARAVANGGESPAAATPTEVLSGAEGKTAAPESTATEGAQEPSPPNLDESTVASAATQESRSPNTEEASPDAVPLADLSPPDLSPEELARAKEEVRMAIACLAAVNRRAAVALRDRALAQRIAEPPARVLERLSREL